MKQDYKPSPRQNTRQNFSSGQTPSTQQTAFIKIINNKKFVLISMGILAIAIAFSLIFTFEKHHQIQLAQKSSQPVQITLAIPATNSGQLVG